MRRSATLKATGRSVHHDSHTRAQCCHIAPQPGIINACLASLALHSTRKRQITISRPMFCVVVCSPWPQPCSCPCPPSLFGVVAEPGCCALAVEYMCDGSLKSALRVLAGLSNSRGTSAPGTRGPGTNGTRPSGSALSTPQGGTSASAPGGGGDGDASPASSAAGAGSSVDGQCPVPRHACAAIALQVRAHN